MQSVKFPQANIALAEDQPEYETLYVHHNADDKTGAVTACFELDKSEIAEIVRTGKIWYTQICFGELFQPISMSTKNPFE